MANVKVSCFFFIDDNTYYHKTPPPPTFSASTATTGACDLVKQLDGYEFPRYCYIVRPQGGVSPLYPRMRS